MLQQARWGVLPLLLGVGATSEAMLHWQPAFVATVGPAAKCAEMQRPGQRLSPIHALHGRLHRDRKHHGGADGRTLPSPPARDVFVSLGTAPAVRASRRAGGGRSLLIREPPTSTRTCGSPGHHHRCRWLLPPQLRPLPAPPQAGPPAIR